MVRRLTALSLVLLTTGCTLGPNYQRPAVPAPQAWREIPKADAQSFANTPWFEVFDDPKLQELIRVAVGENKDLKIAIERIEEARAFYGIAKADLWPKVDVTAGAGRGRVPLASGGSGTDVSQFSLSADVSWEIDFFGRIRRTTEAQQALFLGTQEARRATVIALVADVARAYFELRDFDRRLAITRATIESRREYLQLAKDRFEGGVTAEIDFRQADAELRRVEALVFDYERLIALKENELSVLLGRNPGPILRGRELDKMKLPAAVPAGLPSDLLERRPDVRAAEQSLAAATANIGAAKALLFPRIALTGSLGVSSSELDTLFNSPAQAWSIAAGLLQPIFNAGKNKRRVEVTESQQRQSLYAYEQAILQAFRETEDALVSYQRTGEQKKAQSLRVDAERKVLDLAEIRYRGGVAAYLEVLDAQRSLFNAEIDEAQTLGGHLLSLVRLYKALGGGWQEPAPAAAPAAPAAEAPVSK